MTPLTFVFLGLSITSSWGNGHATPYRSLVRALAARGHRILFLERDVPWYADNRDQPRPDGARTELYRSVPELRRRFTRQVRSADVVVVGSYVPDGIAIGNWVLATARGITAFYDLDTPVTIAALERGEAEYLTREQIPRYDMYLSFAGGTLLERLENQFGARMARALYCSIDPTEHCPVPGRPRWDLGYLGTYSADRQASLDCLLLSLARRYPSRRFVVAGPQYPAHLVWPPNVDRIEHLAPGGHREFYGAQRFTLNLTRAEMRRIGYSPSVRLFEAAACGTPIISDCWEGLGLFFRPGREIFVARSERDVMRCLTAVSDDERRAAAARARRRVLAAYTAAHRAADFEAYVTEARLRRIRRAPQEAPVAPVERSRASA